MKFPRYRRSLLLAGAALFTTSASADDLTISTGVTTPVVTATAANGTPGAVTIVSGGSIITGSGTVLTVNSSNDVSNAGTISSSASTGTTAVLIDGTTGITSNFSNNGGISITGTTTGGTGNTGLLVSGGPVAGSISFGTLGSISVTGDNALGVSIAAPFTGDITLRAVSVTGANSTGVSVTAPVTGNLTLLGSVSSTGAGGQGVLVAAPISGTITNGAAISAGSSQSTDSSGNLVAGNVAVGGVVINANVGGGFVNDRFYVDTNGVRVPMASVDTTVDSLITASLTGNGSGPALLVAPSATNPQAISLGAVGTGADAYAIINRGTISQTLGNNGTAITAVRIGGGGAATILAGGFNSQSTGAILASSYNGSATGINIAAGAQVPALVNQGTMTVQAIQSAASGSTPIGAGGTATGVLVDSGATLQALANSGTISIKSVGTGQGAWGIIDRSGTLASIINTGTITVAAGDTTATVRAIDLTGSNGPVVVQNSGTITGAIAFGGGQSALIATAGTINGNISFGTGASQLLLGGTAAINGIVTAGGALDIGLSGSARLDLTGGISALNSVSGTDSSVLVVPISANGVALNVTGAASFTGTSQIRLSVQSLAAQQNVTIIQAGGGFSTDHLATLVDASNAPFLFTASAPVATSNALTIALTRKSAADIGFSAGEAPLYNASIAGLGGDVTASTAIANLSTQAAVISAYRQIAPPNFGQATIRQAQAVADLGFGAAGARLAAVASVHGGGAPPPGSGSDGTGTWLQEYYNAIGQSGTTNEPGFTGTGFGFAGGIDRPLLGLDAVGIALVADFSTLHIQTGGGTVTPVSSQSVGAEAYAAWTWKALYAQASLMAARVSWNSTRSLTIGSISDSVGAHWAGYELAAGLLVGAHLKFGRLELTPSNSLNWVRLNENGYTETGGGAFDLAVSARHQTAPTDTARLSISYRLPLAVGDMIGEGHYAYVRQLEAKASMIDARFLTASDVFRLTGDPIIASQHDVGGGMRYVHEGVSFGLNYDRRAGGGFTDQTAAAVFAFVY